MYITRLAGFGAAPSCKCPQKQDGTIGVKKVSNIPNTANENDLDLQILEPLCQNLLKSRNEALVRPANIVR